MKITKKQLNVRLSPGLWKRLKIEAAKRDMTLRALVTEAIEAYLAKEKR